jgi:hypothetical protein
MEQLQEIKQWTGFSTQSSRVWFNGRTGEAFSANDDDNHSGGVANNKEFFGLTPEKLTALGVGWDEKIGDYDGRVLYAAMLEGWVRLRIDPRQPDINSNAEGANLRLLRRAVLWYTEAVGMPKNFIIVVRTGPGDRDGAARALDSEGIEYFLQKGMFPRDMLQNSAHPMRRFIAVTEELEEMAGAGPSRILSHIHEGIPFFAISAMRGSNSYRKNRALTRALAQDLDRLPVSNIDIQGGFEETLPDGSTEAVEEDSFFVMPRRAMAHAALDKFKEIGLFLCRKYGQEAICYGDGTDIYILKRDGTTEHIGDAVTFDAAKIKTLPGFSVIKRSKFGFTHQKEHPGVTPYGDREQAEPEALPARLKRT